jgi:hypothetical protein
MPGCGHGHVYPEPEGRKARCGGPAICRKCAIDLARWMNILLARWMDSPSPRTCAQQDASRRIREVLDIMDNYNGEPHGS